MTKLEQINAINAAYEKVNAEVTERCNYRAKNYYDCIDDYSQYGPCWKADMAELDAARRYRDLRLEEVDNNGYHREVTKQYVLTDGNGTILAPVLSHGQFGCYWYDRVNNKNVGVPKKLGTLIKKGYTLALVETAYDCKVKEVTIQMNVRNSEMKLVATKLTILNEIPEYMPYGTAYADWQYETFFKPETEQVA